MIDSRIEFVRFCILDGLSLPRSAEGIDWMDMMLWAEQQAIVGICFVGIEKLKNSKIDIPFDALMEWIWYAQQIEAQNRLQNKRCVEIVDELRKDGFECCILKGQGNALLFPNPMLRMSGDIDIWVRGKGIAEIVSYARKRKANGKAGYHHVDYGEFNGIEVEIHYRPSFRNNLIANWRLQRWFEKHSDEQFRNRVALSIGESEICVPTWEFNVVFQLSHIYRHVIQSGVGMRQLVDYYYLLKSDGRCMMEDVYDTLEYLGLMEIAGAVMWVLKEVLGLEERYLVAPVDERRGSFLLDEILRGGNFGRGMMAEGGWQSSAIGRNVYRLKRDVRLLRYFPSECLWEPVFRVYHFFWRFGV